MILKQIKKVQVAYKVTLFLILTLLVTSQVYAAKIGLDNFNSADQEVCDPTSACTPAATQSSVAYGSALGFERDMAVVRTGGSGTVSAITGVGSDLVAYSQGALTQGTLEIVWDGVDGDPANINHTGLGGFDLTDGGTNQGFYIGGLTNDWAFTLRLEVYTDANNWSFLEAMQPGLQSGVLVPFPFASFSTGGGGGPANFESVGAVRLFADGSAVSALDLSFDYITVDTDTPTAVTLQDISAGSQSPLMPVGAVGIAAIALVSVGIYLAQRRNQVQR